MENGNEKFDKRGKKPRKSKPRNIARETVVCIERGNVLMMFERLEIMVRFETTIRTAI